MRTLSSRCHFPSNTSRAPTSKNPRRDVERPRHISPLAQILQRSPPRDAVIDDEQIPAARLNHTPNRTADTYHRHLTPAGAKPINFRMTNTGSRSQPTRQRQQPPARSQRADDRKEPAAAVHYGGRACANGHFSRTSMSRTARGVTSRPSSTHRNSGSPAPQYSPIHTAEKAAHGLRERSTELNPISERAALKRGVATRVGPCNALALVFVERRIRADRAQQNRCRELCCRLEQVKETTDLVLCRRIGRVAVGDRRQRERQRLNHVLRPPSASSSPSCSSTRLLHLGRAKGVCAARLPRSPCVEAASRCQVFEAGSPVAGA